MVIKVETIDETAFKAILTDRATTTHTVSVSPAYREKLTGGKAPVETLIERSFEFLLKREPNTSILRTFDLQTIQCHFPVYERTIRRMLE